MRFKKKPGSDSDKSAPMSSSTTTSRPGAASPTSRLFLNGVDDNPSGRLSLDAERYAPRSLDGMTGTRRDQDIGVADGGEASATGGTQYQSQTYQRSSSRFLEEMAREINNSTTAAAATSQNPSHNSGNTTTTTFSPALVDPATVPIRTSSRGNAKVNGERSGKSSPESKRSPRKHRSMASVPERRQHVPEADERQWLAQGKQHRNTITSPPQQQQQGQFSMDQPSIASSTGDMAFRGVGADLISGVSTGWSTEKENILKGPYDYLESHPGKDIRTQLITAFNAWLQVPASSLRTITRVVTMLHSASLLIDDVEDSSQLRRGVPVAHSIFGTAQTINSANYVYFCALQELLKLHNPEAVRIYTDELLNLHRGQGMDLFWRDTLTCPSEDDYLEMVGSKTGGLFRLAIKLMCAESPTHNNLNPDDPSSSTSNHNADQADYIPLVNTIGLLFQILDDYKNLSSTTYTSNKGLCEDLTEGKFSFPIIHAIRADPSNLVLVNILKQKTQDEEVKRYAVSYMEKAGSFAYTRRVLRGLTRKAMGLVEEVDNGRGRGELIRGILERLKVERHEPAAAAASAKG